MKLCQRYALDSSMKLLINPYSRWLPAPLSDEREGSRNSPSLRSMFDVPSTALLSGEASVTYELRSHWDGQNCMASDDH